MDFSGIILAAGRGMRVAPAADGRPKALLRIADRPMIDYSLAFLRGIGAKDVVVVAGAFAPETETEARAADPRATVVLNPTYVPGNLPSFLLADARAHGNILVMNVDQLYRASLWGKVPEAFTEDITVFCDFGHAVTAEERGVSVDGRDRVIRIGKGLAEPSAWCVGLTYIPAGRRGAFRAAVPETVARLGERAGYEDVLQTLADDGEPIRAADVSGITSLEITFADDIARTDAAVRASIDEFLP